MKWKRQQGGEQGGEQGEEQGGDQGEEQGGEKGEEQGGEKGEEQGGEQGLLLNMEVHYSHILLSKNKVLDILYINKEIRIVNKL